ncbi:hypothetical protein ABI59_10315 [Acidobacteria bacterium Mor1]|nr:hypothetical protein ABI59_10315 [Acidobacteria bacterium Mor1]
MSITVTTHRSTRRNTGRSSSLLGRTLLALTLLGFFGAEAAATCWDPFSNNNRTIVGRLVYGNIDRITDPDTGSTLNDDGNLIELVDGNDYLSQGDPLGHVEVELDDGWTIQCGTDITDADGNFRIQITGTPNLTMKVKARNDYVRVKKFKGVGQNLGTDKVLKTKIDVSDLIDWSACPVDSVCDLGDIEAVNDNDHTFNTMNGNQENMKSRAFYITTMAHILGQYIEDLNDSNIPGESVVVRLGMNNNKTAWYERVMNTIYLPGADAPIFLHEYGHFLQDKIAAFSAVPSYNSHAECNEITDRLSSDPNLCWGWFEGFAEWYAVEGGIQYFGSYDDLLLGHWIYDIEDNPCDAGEVTAWQDPRAVESVVANVLWDLIDSDQDHLDPDGDGETPSTNPLIDEVAEVPVQWVIDVFTAKVPAHKSCGLADLNSHPVGLDEFWDEYRIQRGGDDVVVPDLYAAYAYNGADIGNAQDVLSPDPVSISTTSHVIGLWSNKPMMDLRIVDGSDDVSGSYRYYVDDDDVSDTELPTGGTPWFSSKLLENNESHSMSEGRDRWVHVQSEDMAGHPGTATAHLGPFLIDLTDPYITDMPLPIEGDTFVLGYLETLQWESQDDLSGVDHVEIDYVTDSGATYSIADNRPEDGSFAWRVDDVPAPSTGVIRYTAVDRAGNTGSGEVKVSIVPVFEGMDLNLDIDAAVVIAADLNQDGDDEVILGSRTAFGGGNIYVLGGNGGGATFISQIEPWNAVDDLYASDVDRDGDLDVLTVSYNPAGGMTFLEMLRNDGSGTLVPTPMSEPLGALSDKVVRVITANDRPRPLIVVFGENNGAAPGPRVMAWDFAGAMAPVSLGIDPMTGDWETADINQDGYYDAVSLGEDATGAAGLRVFWGGATGFTRDDIEFYGTTGAGDLDLGDFDADGLSDAFVMFDDGAVRVTKLMQQSTTGFSAYATAGSFDHQIAAGDGKIVDHENDAWGAVVALGLHEANGVSGWYLRNRTGLGTVQSDSVSAITLLHGTDTAWGDFGNDGDLEPFMIGYDINNDLRIISYESNIADYIERNDYPAAPIKLQSSYDAARNGYLFTWEAPGVHGDETPEPGFGYELRVGSAPGLGDILSWSFQAGPSLQGSGLERFIQLPGGVYFAEVRSVDSGWRRSNPSSTHQTTNPTTGPGGGSSGGPGGK